MFPAPKIFHGGMPGAPSLGISAPQSLQQIPNLPMSWGGIRFRPFGTAETCDAPVFEEHRYARLNGTQVFTNISQTNPATLVLPEVSPAMRNFLMLRNASATANLFIDFDRQADAFSVLRITPNTIVLWDTVVPQDQMTCFADAASGVLSLWVATIPGNRC